jgi:hypothetical protein
MMEFRHITNLATPYDDLDQEFLAALGDGGRIGDPLCLDPAVTKPVAQLKEDGIVGLYATWEAMQDHTVQAKTGWNIALQDWNKLPVMESAQ